MGNTHNGTLLSNKKEKKITPFIRRRNDLENSMLSEISQTQKEKGHMFSLIYLSQGIFGMQEGLQIMENINSGAREKG